MIHLDVINVFEWLPSLPIRWQVLVPLVHLTCRLPHEHKVRPSRSQRTLDVRNLGIGLESATKTDRKSVKGQHVSQ